MTNKKKKTLSDNISFLLSNASGKLVNPDEDINIESKARVVEEEDSEGDLNDTEVGPSKLRQKNVALLDALDRKYRGGVISRKALKNSGSESDEERSEEDSQDDEDDNDNDDDLSDDDNEADSLADSEDEAVAHIRKKGSESFASFTDFNDDDVESEDRGAGLDGEDTENSGSDEKEEETSGGGIQHFSAKDTYAEVKKGQAVRSQLGVWDTLMECRIQLQKVAIYSNQLPRAKVMPTFHSLGGGGFSSNLAKVENSVKKLLDSLLNLQENLLKQYSETKDLSNTTAKIKMATKNDGMDEEIPSSDDEKEDDDSFKNEAIGSDAEDTDEMDEEINGEGEDTFGSGGNSGSNVSKKRKKGVNDEKPFKRRKLVDYSNVIAKHHEEFTPYCNNTIQKWNTKTQVAIGRASSKNFSAFEQSTLQQVEHILANKPRLIRRTQLRRSDYKVLGQKEKEEQEKSEEPEERQTLPDVPPVDDQNNSESNKDYDPEIFDDTDFYHQLLRELIEKKTADVTDPVQLGRQWIELQKMRSKMKRKVDVKASKGRRLRFSVHPKLVNFMAPQQELAWSEEAKNELYGSLFGQRKT